MIVLLLLVLHRVFSSEVSNPLSAVLLQTGVVQDTVYQPVWPLQGVQYHVHEKNLNNTGGAASFTTENSEYFRQVQQHISSIGNGLLLLRKQISFEWNQTAVYSIFNTCEQRLNNLKLLELQNLPQRIQIKVEHLEQSVENIKTTIFSIVQSQAQVVDTSSTLQLFEQWEITLENIIKVMGHSNKIAEEDRLKLAKISIQVLSVLEAVEKYDIKGITRDNLYKIKLIHDVIKDYEKYNVFSVKSLINITNEGEDHPTLHTNNNITDLKYENYLPKLTYLVNSLNKYLNNLEADKSLRNVGLKSTEINNYKNRMLEEVKRLGEQNIPASLIKIIFTLQKKVDDFRDRTKISDSINMDRKETTTQQKDESWKEYEDLIHGLKQNSINFKKYLPSEISVGGLNNKTGQLLTEVNATEKHSIPTTLAKLIETSEKIIEPFKNKKVLLDTIKTEQNQSKPHQNKQPLDKLEDLVYNLEHYLINLQAHQYRENSDEELKNKTEQILAELNRLDRQNIPTTLLEIIQMLQKRVENFINKPPLPNNVDRDGDKTTNDMRYGNFTKLQDLLLSFEHNLMKHEESELVRCTGFRVLELRNLSKELLVELKNIEYQHIPKTFLQKIQNIQIKLEECIWLLKNKEIQNNMIQSKEFYIENYKESADFIKKLTDMVKFLENYLYHLGGHEKLEVYKYDILALNKNFSEELSKLGELNITLKHLNRIRVLKERVDNFINLNYHLIQLQDVLNRLTSYIIYVHANGSLVQNRINTLHLSIIMEQILEHLIYLREYNIIPKTLIYSVLNLQKKVKYIKNRVAGQLPHVEATDNVHYIPFEENQHISKTTYKQFEHLQKSVKTLENYMKYLEVQGYSSISQVHLLDLKSKINTLLIEIKKIGELNILNNLYKSILTLQRQVLSLEKKISVYSSSNRNSGRCMITNQNEVKCTKTLQNLINNLGNDLMIIELSTLDLKSRSENILADLRRFGANRLPINLVRMVITQHKTIEQLNTIMQLYSKHALPNNNVRKVPQVNR